MVAAKQRQTPSVHHPNISHRVLNWLNSVVILTSFHLEICGLVKSLLVSVKKNGISTFT